MGMGSTAGSTAGAAADSASLEAQASSLSNTGMQTSLFMAQLSLINNMVAAFTNLMGQMGNNIKSAVQP
jgi:hypothetical protein